MWYTTQMDAARQDETAAQDAIAAREGDVEAARAHVAEMEQRRDAQQRDLRDLQGDIDAGLRTGDVIARSLAKLPLYEALHTVKIDTAEKDAAGTAAEIMRAAAEQEDGHG